MKEVEAARDKQSGPSGKLNDYSNTTERLFNVGSVQEREMGQAVRVDPIVTIEDIGEERSVMQVHPGAPEVVGLYP